jgi:hypothetical protein
MIHRIRTGAYTLLSLSLLALIPVHAAQAEVHVTALADIVRIEAHDASVEDVLSTLRERFGLQYRTAAPLDRPISGIYEGPLYRVVTRLLVGYDFIVKIRAGVLSVMIVGASPLGQFQEVPPARERRH